MDITRRRFLESCAAGGVLSLPPDRGLRPWSRSASRTRWAVIPTATGRKSISTSIVMTTRSPGSAPQRHAHVPAEGLCSQRRDDPQRTKLRPRRCGDLYGNTATKAWNPRGCPKGYTMQRRVYGPYRLRGARCSAKDGRNGPTPAVRRFRTHPQLRTQYKFDDRGNDGYVRVSWDEVSKYVARRCTPSLAPTAAKKEPRG